MMRRPAVTARASYVARTEALASNERRCEGKDAALNVCAARRFRTNPVSLPNENPAVTTTPFDLRKSEMILSARASLLALSRITIVFDFTMDARYREFRRVRRAVTISTISTGDAFGR